MLEPGEPLAGRGRKPGNPGGCGRPGGLRAELRRHPPGHRPLLPGDAWFAARLLAGPARRGCGPDRLRPAGGERGRRPARPGPGRGPRWRTGFGDTPLRAGDGWPPGGARPTRSICSTCPVELAAGRGGAPPGRSVARSGRGVGVGFGVGFVETVLSLAAAHLCGLRLLRAGEGIVELAGRADAQLERTEGVVHGGAVPVLGQLACAAALASAFPEMPAPRRLDTNTEFLRPTLVEAPWRCGPALFIAAAGW